MDEDRAKNRNRKRPPTRAIMIGIGKDNISGNDTKEPALKGYGKTQNYSKVTTGRATSDQIASLVANEEHRDVDAGTEQNAGSVKDLRKRKRNADGEIEQAMMSSPDIKSSRLRPRKEVRSFHMVELNETDSEKIVGMRIKVYWPDSRKWFAGTIKSFSQEKRLHKINYDDGDVEELELKNERFELQVKPSDGFEIKPLLRSKKAKKDVNHGVVPNTSLSLDYDVKTSAGETNKSVEPKEDVKPYPGKQQAADTSRENNVTEAKKLGLTTVEIAKSFDYPASENSR